MVITGQLCPVASSLQAAERREQNPLAARIFLPEQHTSCLGLTGGQGCHFPVPEEWQGEAQDSLVPLPWWQWSHMAHVWGQLQEQMVLSLAEDSAAVPGHPVHACTDPGFSCFGCLEELQQAGQSSGE